MHSRVRVLHFPRNSCIQQPKWKFLCREDVPPRAQNTRFSTCYIAIFSRKVVHSIAQICYAFHGICASRNLKYYISGNLCTQELKAQNFQAIYAFKSSKCHMEVCASRSSNTTFSKGIYAFESPKCSKECVLPRAHDTTFFGAFVPSSACRAHPSSSNSAWPLALLVPVSLAKFWEPYSQNLAVKECCFVPRGICGGFFMKSLVATFHGKWAKIMTRVWTRFSTVSAKTFAWISLSGIMFIEKIVDKYRLLSLFVPMPCHIHPQTPSHTRLEVRGQSATPTANGQLDPRGAYEKPDPRQARCCRKAPRPQGHGMAECRHFPSSDKGEVGAPGGPTHTHTKKKSKGGKNR